MEMQSGVEIRDLQVNPPSREAVSKIKKYSLCTMI